MRLQVAGFSHGVNQPNEDAFVHRMVGFPSKGSILTYAAVFDGAGKAGGVARRACRWLEAAMQGISPVMAQDPATWRALVRRMDLQAEASGGQTTTMTLAVVIGEDALVLNVGNSFAAHVEMVDGGTNASLPERSSLIYDSQNRRQLGSGEARPAVTTLKLKPHDQLILATDGLFGLGLAGVTLVVTRNALKPVAEAAEDLVGEAGRRRILMDDATAVVIRALSGSIV